MRSVSHSNRKELALGKVSLAPKGFMLPLPTVMLSCQLANEQPNIITISWIGVLASTPPQIGVGIQPKRHSHLIVKESGEFVINVPSADLAKEADYCGHASGSKHDKFAELNLTPEKGLVVSAPIIAECPVNIECKVLQIVNLGSHDLFSGEIVAIQVDESCLDKDGNPDIIKVNPFAYVPFSRKYVSGLSDLLGVGGFSIKK